MELFSWVHCFPSQNRLILRKKEKPLADSPTLFCIAFICHNSPRLFLQQPSFSKCNLTYSLLQLSSLHEQIPKPLSLDLTFCLIPFHTLDLNISRSWFHRFKMSKRIIFSLKVCSFFLLFYFSSHLTFFTFLPSYSFSRHKRRCLSLTPFFISLNIILVFALGITIYPFHSLLNISVFCLLKWNVKITM